MKHIIQLPQRLPIEVWRLAVILFDVILDLVVLKDRINSVCTL